MALKTSILVFYLRLSKNTQQVLRIASWVVLAIVTVAGAVLTLLNVFQCRPVASAFSTVYTGNSQCIPLLTEFICSAPINVVTDLAILALPIPVLTSMRLPRRQKYILVFTFSLGVFVTVVDVVRIYYLQQAISSVPTTTSTDPNAIFGDSPQFAWNASLSLMWSAVEVNVGIICACIPTLKPLIIKILPAAIVDPGGTPDSNLSTYGTGSAKDTLPTQTMEPPPSSQVTKDEDVTAPLPAAALPGSADHEMDILEFLTTPDIINQNRNDNRGSAVTGMENLHSPGTKTTFMSHRSRHDNAIYFGFVNMKRPKSMIKTSPSESIRYCIIVTVLFLLWGFSYGLLNTLNNVIASIANMSMAETIGLTSAYFGGGYFFGPLIVGEWVLRHDEHARFHRRRHKNRDPVGGFKATFIMGLSIYGIGTIMFWPCAVLTSFPGFIISNFVVGFGLGVLETAANPFIILCGPRQYAEVRILIAQGFQGVATVLSGLLAQKVFFGDLDDDRRLSPTELLDVQWTYLAITLFCVALALFFYYMPLPEVRDAELGRAAEQLPVEPKKRSIGGMQLRTICIIFAVAAQWAYVAVQESMSIFFTDIIIALVPTSSTSSSSSQSGGLALAAADYLLVAHAAFSISRFSAAYVAWLGVNHPSSRIIPSPRTLLTLSTAFSIFFALICVVLRPGNNPNVIAIPAVLFFFAEGPIWPLIFALGLRGQGDRTKRASAWLTMAASGPAFWPFVIYGIVRNGASVQLAFVVLVVLPFVTLAYPVFLTMVRDARDLVDPVSRGRRSGAGGGIGGFEDPEGSGATTRDASVNFDEEILRRARGRSGSVATMGSTGVILSLMDRFRLMRTRMREREGSGSSYGSSKCRHRETEDARRDSGVGDGVEMISPLHIATIPEER